MSTTAISTEQLETIKQKALDALLYLDDLFEDEENSFNYIQASQRCLCELLDEVGVEYQRPATAPFGFIPPGTI